MIRIISDGPMLYPRLYCDHCTQRIWNAERANYVWRMPEAPSVDDRSPTEIAHVHKSCSDAFERANDDGRLWLSDELPLLLVRLGANAGLHWRKVAKELPRDRRRPRRAQPREGWDFLVMRDPRLGALLDEARSIQDRGGSAFCANSIWYANGGLKEALTGLVGWSRKGDRFLGTEKAYDIVYRTIYDTLPPCRNCMCVPSGM